MAFRKRGGEKRGDEESRSPSAMAMVAVMVVVVAVVAMVRAGKEKKKEVKKIKEQTLGVRSLIMFPLVK